VFNPPYLPSEEKDECLWLYGGSTGCEVIEKFLSETYNFLTNDGVILFVASSLSNVDVIINEFKDLYEFRVLDERKLFFESLKVYLAKFKK